MLAEAPAEAPPAPAPAPAAYGDTSGPKEALPPVAGPISFGGLPSGSLLKGVVKVFTPDVEPNVAIFNVGVLLTMVACEIIKCISLAQKGHCGSMFQDILDLCTFGICTLWMLWVISYLKDAHPELKNAYSPSSLIYHTFVGNASDMMWSVMTSFALAYFFKLHAVSDKSRDEGLTWETVAVLIVQGISYFVLWMMMVALENSYNRIRFVSLMASLQSWLFMITSIVMHLIYQFNLNEHTKGLAATEASTSFEDDFCVVTYGTTDFVGSRVLSLAAFVSVRLTCFKFFGFKRKYPFMAYCKDSKDHVDSLSFASAAVVNRVTADAAESEDVGFGGTTQGYAHGPGQLPRALSNLKDLIGEGGLGRP